MEASSAPSSTSSRDSYADNAAHQDRRRPVDEPEFDAEALHRRRGRAWSSSRQQGWVKRQQRVQGRRHDARARGRRGDRGDRRLDPRARWRSSRTPGRVYVLRINDIPPTTGYGVPVQTLFKFGRRRAHRGDDGLRPALLRRACGERGRGRAGAAHALAVTRGGIEPALLPEAAPRAVDALGPPLLPARRRATRSCTWRRSTRAIASPARPRTASALICEAKDVSLLAGPGQGVM